MDWKKHKIEWTYTGNASQPFQATAGGKRLQLRLNDFPAEEMFTLFVEGIELESFSEWPDDSWNQPDIPDPPSG